MDSNTPILNFLLEHKRVNAISFHMPGHKGSALYRSLGYDEFLDNIMDCDVTEICGADNLFQAEGILKETQEIYADLYDVKKSYLLINGTSGGIIAAILASVPKGKKLIMARNCHKSVFNALTLGDIQPLYAYPEMIDQHGISGAIPPEEIALLLENNPDAEAVILPSPNYYGVCSDIEAIALITHKYNKILIVDQAHGAHLKMFDKFGIKGFPKAAELSGADIIINSIHKTLASFTQSAVLNLNSDRVSPYLIEDKLQCIESTSPSYLLMASLGINAAILKNHGQKLMQDWFENLNYFYEEAKNIKDLDFIEKEPGMDWTKINFSFGKLGIKGNELEKILLEKYNIFIELYTGNLVMCMTGIGNTKSDISLLLNALNEISTKHRLLGLRREIDTHIVGKPVPNQTRAPIFNIPIMKDRVPLLEVEGLICASSIIPYPPGIPLVCPGEKFDKETILYIKSLRENGEKVIGLNELNEVLVGVR
jgi:lysine decarboxylase